MDAARPPEPEQARRSSLAIGAAVLVVVSVLLAAGRLIVAHLPSRLRGPTAVCLVPVELIADDGESLLACASDEQFKRCGTILNAGDRVQLEAAGCKVGRNAMNATMRLAEGLRLDLNSASAADLARIDGVDHATAARIVERREAYGPFRGLGDLDAIEGVGPATLSRLLATCEVLP